jgi:hypothetical protein
MFSHIRHLAISTLSSSKTKREDQLFPLTLYIPKHGTYMLLRPDNGMSSNVQFYKKASSSTIGKTMMLRAKYVHLTNTEYKFHMQNKDSTVLTPFAIIPTTKNKTVYHIMVYKDKSKSRTILHKKDDIWLLQQHKTTKRIKQVYNNMLSFHRRYKMALNTIRLDNLRFYQQSTQCLFTNLEKIVQSEKDETDYPQGFTSYEKYQFLRFDKKSSYDIFANDRYALGVTIYQIVTGNPSPSKNLTMMSSLTIWRQYHTYAISVVEEMLWIHNWEHRCIQFLCNLLYSLFYIPIN